MLFTCLLVLASLQQSYGLTCVANSSFSIPRSTLVSMNKNDVVQWLNRETANHSTDSAACHVTMFIGYDPTTGNDDIRFGQDKHRTGNHFRMKILFPLDKQSGSNFIYVELVCSADDLCDRDFLRELAGSLAELDYDEDQDAWIEILASDGNSSKCNASNQAVSCPSGMFVTVYTAPGIKNADRSRCTDNKISQLEVKWEANKFPFPCLIEIEHTHRQDQCISEDVFHPLWQELLKLDDCFKPMVDEVRRMNGVPTTSNPQLEERQATGTVSHHTTTPRVNKTKTTSTIGRQKSQDGVTSSDLYKWVFIAWLAAVVPFSVIALIWYYCRSRRNRRGYQAASTTQ